MAEILELIKAAGPAVAILIWLVWKLWLECGEKEKQIYQLYERLLNEIKQDSLTNIRMLQAHLEGKGEIIAQSYIEFLKKQADELQNEINQSKKGG